MPSPLRTTLATAGPRTAPLAPGDVEGGQHDERQHRQPLVGAGRAQHLEAAHPRHHQIQHHGVELSVAQEGQPLAAGRRRRDGVTDLFEPGGDVRPLCGVVVDEQDPGSCRVPGSSRLRGDARAGLGQRDRQLEAQPLLVAGPDLDGNPDASGEARGDGDRQRGRAFVAVVSLWPILIGEGEGAAGRFGEAIVGVPHANDGLPRGVVDGDLDVAVLRGRQEVFDHAFEQVAEAPLVGGRGQRLVPQAHLDGDPLLAAGGLVALGDLPHQGRQIERVDVDFAPARLDGREIQDVIDQPQHRLTTAADHLDILALLHRERSGIPLDEQLAERDQRAEWAAEIMAHPQEEEIMREVGAAALLRAAIVRRRRRGRQGRVGPGLRVGGAVVLVTRGGRAFDQDQHDDGGSGKQRGDPDCGESGCRHDDGSHVGDPPLDVRTTSPSVNRRHRRERCQ